LHFLSHTLKFLKTTNFACPLFPDAIFFFFVVLPLFFFVVLPLFFLSISIKRYDKFSNSDVTGLTFRKLLLFPSRGWQWACGAILQHQINKIQAGRKHREQENEAEAEEREDAVER
jgi:hypothetical protein